MLWSYRLDRAVGEDAAAQPVMLYVIRQKDLNLGVYRHENKCKKPTRPGKAKGRGSGGYGTAHVQGVGVGKQISPAMASQPILGPQPGPERSRPGLEREAVKPLPPPRAVGVFLAGDMYMMHA